MAEKPCEICQQFHKSGHSEYLKERHAAREARQVQREAKAARQAYVRSGDEKRLEGAKRLATDEPRAKKMQYKRSNPLPKGGKRSSKP